MTLPFPGHERKMCVQQQPSPLSKNAPMDSEEQAQLVWLYNEA